MVGDDGLFWMEYIGVIENKKLYYRKIMYWC